MLATRTIQCPYCGEWFETTIDVSAGSQEYIEDCYVCCRPIVFDVRVDEDGSFSVTTRTENE